MLPQKIDPLYICWVGINTFSWNIWLICAICSNRTNSSRSFDTCVQYNSFTIICIPLFISYNTALQNLELFLATNWKLRFLKIFWRWRRWKHLFWPVKYMRLSKSPRSCKNRRFSGFWPHPHPKMGGGESDMKTVI